MITREGNVTVENTEEGTSRCEHVSEREAAVYAARKDLEAAGYHVALPSSNEGYRLPLLGKGERMGEPVSGATPRARGYTATKDGAVLRVDASGETDPVVLLQEGDVTEALEISRRHLSL